MTKKIDLYLGGNMGSWVLENISLSVVNNIFTKDTAIINKIKNTKINLYQDDPNIINFKNAPLGLSIHYPKILSEQLILRYKNIFNLHPSYLPWGRGYYPVFWSIWEKTPAGATLHEITAEIDKGNIVSQIQVNQYVDDTGISLHNRVTEAEKKIFLENWPKIINNKKLGSIVQQNSGTYHSKKDFFNIKQHANLKMMNGDDLVRLIRALTFTNYSGLEILLGKKKFELILKPLDEKNINLELT